MTYDDNACNRYRLLFEFISKDRNIFGFKFFLFCYFFLFFLFYSVFLL